MGCECDIMGEDWDVTTWRVRNGYKDEGCVVPSPPPPPPPPHTHLLDCTRDHLLERSDLCG